MRLGRIPRHARGLTVVERHGLTRIRASSPVRFVPGLSQIADASNGDEGLERLGVSACVTPRGQMSHQLLDLRRQGTGGLFLLVVLTPMPKLNRYSASK